jgi:riboflavin biosynthesis pyrimidine reductase
VAAGLARHGAVVTFSFRGHGASGGRSTVGDKEVLDLAAAVEWLAAERGWSRQLCEGGPRLLGQLAGLGLVDELCLTVSPLLAGGAAGRIVDAAGAVAAGPAGQALAGAEPAGGAGSRGSLGRLTLGHVLAGEGHLLCRYRRAG